MRLNAWILSVTLASSMMLIASCLGDEAGNVNGESSGSSGADGSASDSPNNNNADTSTAADVVDAGPAFVCDVTPCAVQISAGGAHTCARMSDGTVRCWGGNAFGESGGGTVSPPNDGGIDEIVTPSTYPTPNIVMGLSGVTVVGAGGAYRSNGVSCGASSDLKMYCWGIDKSQQLGRGGGELDADLNPAPAHPIPGPVANITNVVDVSVGVRHVCAIFTAGAVACWGGNVNGAVGLSPSGRTFGSPQTIQVPAKLTRVVSRGQHNIALDADGKVWGWGENLDGQHGKAATQLELPSQITSLIGKYVDIAAGRFHGCALDMTAKVWCWGKGSDGQLGRGPASLVASDPDPKTVSFPGGAIVKQISGDEQHMVALLDDGTVYEWGRMRIVVGAIKDAPAQVGLPKKAVGVSAGYEHTCALLEGGSVACWGNNESGELGRGSVGGVFDIPSLVVW